MRPASKSHMKSNWFHKFFQSVVPCTRVPRPHSKCTNRNGDKIDDSCFTNATTIVSASSQSLTLNFHRKIEDFLSSSSFSDSQKTQTDIAIPKPNNYDSSHLPCIDLEIDRGDTKITDIYHKQVDTIHINNPHCHSDCVDKNEKNDKGARDEINNKLLKTGIDDQMIENETNTTNKTTVKCDTMKQYEGKDSSNKIVNEMEKRVVSPKSHGVTFRESSNVIHVYHAARIPHPRSYQRTYTKGNRKNIRRKKTSCKVATPSAALTTPTKQRVLKTKETRNQNGGLQVCLDDSCVSKFMSNASNDTEEIDRSDSPLFRFRIQWEPNDPDEKSENCHLQSQEDFDCDMSNNSCVCCRKTNQNGLCFTKDLKRVNVDQCNEERLCKRISERHYNFNKKTHTLKCRRHNQIVRNMQMTNFCEKENDGGDKISTEGVVGEGKGISYSPSNPSRVNNKEEERHLLKEQTSTNNFSANLHNQSLDSSHQPIYYRRHQHVSPNAVYRPPIYFQATKPDLRSSKLPVYHYAHREPESTNMNFASSYISQNCRVSQYQQPSSYIIAQYSSTPVSRHQERGQGVNSYRQHHYDQCQMTPTFQEQFFYQPESQSVPVSQSHSSHEYYPMPTMNVNSIYEPDSYSVVDQGRLYDNPTETRLIDDMTTQIHAFSNLLNENEEKIKALEESLRQAKSRVCRVPRRVKIQSPKGRVNRNIPPPVHLHPPSRPFFPTHPVLTRRPVYIYQQLVDN